MDNENQLQKYTTFSQSKTQRSTSFNQNSQKKEIAKQLKPQAMLKKLEEILSQRQSKFNQEQLKKKKGVQCKVDYTERIQGKKSVQKLLEDGKCKTDLQNFVTEKKERKSAYPNIKSLQPSAQNLFDIFSHDCNSRNPTSTNRSRKCEISPKKGRANSIIEGQNGSERDKLTLIQLNQHLQMQNHHLNEQLRFEQSQSTKLSLQIISMNDQITVLTKYSIFLFRKLLDYRDEENDDIMRSLKSQLDMIRPEYYKQQESIVNLESQLIAYQNIEKEMKEIEQMLPQISTFTSLFVQQNAQILELQDLMILQNNIIDKVLNRKDIKINNIILAREPKQQKQYTNDLPFESSQLLDNLLRLTRQQVNILTESFIHELLL
ncbi:unnamed protein product (macronuclear) [Paramecium tetraurelia]|uniref:t-SNARE coiled-coil homology domain-containing protein n=1 Tax=Paramecium tetraurelia TaxID=5888 RepID=A0E4Q2_PARTE|nr:uncharacterized protein GSPATT00023444001 [Paramecium tetraurelia]CAK90269.1 unnamed protein product [Paramecium tetraurelia]|eukprot:XP_001457666.1 hypothetical protein (macronuclear) [Paramecium tetraurelia strain d4-2]